MKSKKIKLVFIIQVKATERERFEIRCLAKKGKYPITFFYPTIKLPIHQSENVLPFHYEEFGTTCWPHRATRNIFIEQCYPLRRECNSLTVAGP